jgi:hypothetical protein
MLYLGDKITRYLEEELNWFILSIREVMSELQEYVLDGHLE